MGRRARRLLQQLPASRLHQQRPQHLLRPGRLLPAHPQTRPDPSPGQAPQGWRRPHLPRRPLRHRLQHGAPQVLHGRQQNHQRDLRVHRDLVVERHRMRSRRHLRLHAHRYVNAKKHHQKLHYIHRQCQRTNTLFPSPL